MSAKKSANTSRRKSAKGVKERKERFCEKNANSQVCHRPLNELFRGAVFDHSGVPENCPLVLMGPFSLVGACLATGTGSLRQEADSVSKTVLRSCGCFCLVSDILRWIERAPEAQNRLRQ